MLKILPLADKVNGDMVVRVPMAMYRASRGGIPSKHIYPIVPRRRMPRIEPKRAQA
jgi:hypothetical protein